MLKLICMVFLAFLLSCLFVGVKRVFGTGRRLVNKLFDKLDKWIDNKSQEAKRN